MNLRYINVPTSFFTLGLWKILYQNQVQIQNFMKVFAGPRSELIITGNNALLEVKGRLVLRKDISINIKDGSLIIGEQVFFNRGCSLNCHYKIEIGEGCIFGENVLLYDHDHNFKEEGLFQSQGFSKKEIIIEDNVWIGSGTIILKGTYIGKNSVVGAGSLVKGHILPNTIFYNKRENFLKPMINNHDNNISE
ncbi:acyltransferase [Geminocystis sp. GBBB08]|uniref:acyltransferase n=1 Tax=Geminocystis sp. GBBB08 TaxID=2604140 RepID=UPI0027E38120|nr:acyltransferase [Geminocystis sp. GBBB08]